MHLHSLDGIIYPKPHATVAPMPLVAGNARNTRQEFRNLVEVTIGRTVLACGGRAFANNERTTSGRSRSDGVLMDPIAPEQLTRLLGEAAGGDSHAAQELLPLVYEQLRELARRRMTDERAAHTLQATALVHEAYLRLVGNRQVPWSGRAHFFAAAAEAMRRILIDHARAHRGPKRGNGQRPVPLSVLDLAVADQSAEILSLDEAVSRLEAVSGDLAQVVRLRFYAGLSVEEAAEVIGVAPRTVERRWAAARAWLFRELEYDDR